jgi:hypothetical protein
MHVTTAESRGIQKGSIGLTKEKTKNCVNKFEKVPNFDFSMIDTISS